MTRIPLIIAAPGVTQSDSRTARPVGTIDLFPTLNELCSLPAFTSSAARRSGTTPALVRKRATSGLAKIVAFAVNPTCLGRQAPTTSASISALG